MTFLSLLKITWKSSDSFDKRDILFDTYATGYRKRTRLVVCLQLQILVGWIKQSLLFHFSIDIYSFDKQFSLLILLKQFFSFLLLFSFIFRQKWRMKKNKWEKTNCVYFSRRLLLMEFCLLNLCFKDTDVYIRWYLIIRVMLFIIELRC
jgi:hypothetical protein